MPYNLLLLPLLGGFLFLHLCHRFRFRAQRLDGNRLLVESAVAGAVLLLLSRLLVTTFGITRLGQLLGGWWTTFAPFPFSETSAISLLIGPLLAYCINARIGLAEAKSAEIARHGNAFIQLLHQANEQEQLISITLDTRKWYVGMVAESPNLDPTELYFRLIPILSGYRDKDTLRTYRTVSYQEILQNPDFNPAEFTITLPLKDVKIANLFDANAYQDYFAEPQTGS